mgnify:CR=1 FL=1
MALGTSISLSNGSINSLDQSKASGSISTTRVPTDTGLHMFISLQTFQLIPLCEYSLAIAKLKLVVAV